MSYAQRAHAHRGATAQRIIFAAAIWKAMPLQIENGWLLA
jgi:hypothetical protein